jgi:hypothetical protein
MSDAQKRPPWWLWPLIIALSPLIVIVLLGWLLTSLVLLSAVWLTWCPRRRYALVVYSNSPVWQDYFETNVIPLLGDRAVVLNWSERERWKPTLPVMLFRVFAGTREFNPIAIVFLPFLLPRSFRFYKAFKAFKHGRTGEVETLRVEFFQLLDRHSPPKAT